MSHGKRISKAVNELIAKEAISNPKMDRRLLAAELQHRIELMLEPVPTEETLTKMISKYRNQEHDDLDKPWSLSKSKRMGISPESTPVLLRLLKYNISLESLFTIRDAKWASYLGTIITDIGELDTRVKQYSLAERVYKSLGEDFNSFDLDSALTMSDVELSTMTILGKIAPFPTIVGHIFDRPSSFVSSPEDSHEASAMAEYEALVSLRFTDDTLNTFKNALSESSDDWGILPSIKEMNLTEDIVWVYVYWLQTLINGPKWRKLKRDEAIDTIKKLREWTANFSNNKTEILKAWYKLAHSKGKLHPMDVFSRVDFLPFELLKKAGYYADNSPSSIPGNWPALNKRMNKLSETIKVKLNGMKE